MGENFNIRNYCDTNELTEQEIQRAEFWITANRVVRETGKENFEEAKIIVNSNWNLDKLEEWLGESYEDKDVINYLKYGWPLNAHDTDSQDKIPPNQAGAQANAAEVRDWIKQERNRGSIIGPFTKNPFGKFARISPLDTRPKKDTDELRIILNLSHPFEEGSVNHSISKETYAKGEIMDLRYPSTDDMAKLI